MKRKLIIFAAMGVIALAAFADVLVVTSCGETLYTLSRDKYYELGQDDGRGYDEYLKDINEAKCGTRVLPKTFEVVE